MRHHSLGTTSSGASSYSSSSSYSSDHKRGIDARQELDKLLMQLGRKMSQHGLLHRTPHRNPHMPNTSSTSSPAMSYSKTTQHTSHVRTHATSEEEKEIMRQLLLKKRAIQKRQLMEKQRYMSNIKKEPEVVDLTANSPEPSVKQDEYIQEISRECIEKSSQKVPRTPKQEHQSTALQTPFVDVAGKTLTFKEAIETACKIVGEAVGETGKPELKNEKAFEIKRMSINETDGARPISLVLNTKNSQKSDELHKDGKRTNSFCHRHRRLLFPADLKQESTKTSVADIPRTQQHMTTLSQMINDHFKSNDPHRSHDSRESHDPRKHDPRKKHLASLSTQKSEENYVKKEKDEPPLRLLDSPSFTTSESEPSPPIPETENAEQRRRKRLNLEINRIANTASYVGDLPKKPRSGDLLVDSSLLDREERALQVRQFHIVIVGLQNFHVKR